MASKVSLLAEIDYTREETHYCEENSIDVGLDESKHLVRQGRWRRDCRDFIIPIDDLSCCFGACKGVILDFGRYRSHPDEREILHLSRFVHHATIEGCSVVQRRHFTCIFDTPNGSGIEESGYHCEWVDICKVFQCLVLLDDYLRLRRRDGHEDESHNICPIGVDGDGGRLDHYDLEGIPQCVIQREVRLDAGEIRPRRLLGVYESIVVVYQIGRITDSGLLVNPRSLGRCRSGEVRGSQKDHEGDYGGHSDCSQLPPAFPAAPYKSLRATDFTHRDDFAPATADYPEPPSRFC